MVERLGYPVSEQHYFSGFVLRPEDRAQWLEIAAAADAARAAGVARAFIWALPQIARDGFVAVDGEADVQDFAAVDYTLAIGREAMAQTEFSTQIISSPSGHEQRASEWAEARMRYDAGPGVRSEADIRTLADFFRARRGAARGFRLRDPSDFSSNAMSGPHAATDQLIGTGDGIGASFPLIKRYGEGDAEQLRRITRPHPGSVLVSVDGASVASGWTLEPGGIVRFAVPPAVGALIRAGFLFDVPVRFAEDKLEVSGAVFAAGEAPSVPVIEIREAAP
jgi:uncharacterized protein (TIGR02217 family)